MDRYKLEYELKSRHITVAQLCKAIDMSRSAYFRKLNGTSDFTVTEVRKICDYLGVTPMGIFFTFEVS